MPNGASDPEPCFGNTVGGIRVRLRVEILYLTYSAGVTLDRCLSYQSITNLWNILSAPPPRFISCTLNNPEV